MNRLISNLPVLLVFTVFLFSCAGPQKTIYFRTDIKEDNPVVETTAIKDVEVEGLILPNDIVAINITTITSLDDKNPAAIFKDGGINYNLITGGGAMGGGGGGGGTVQTPGYLVDKEGFIDFPVVGKIAIGGMTIRQAKDLISSKLKDYVKEPVVELRIVNYSITVLGEVGRVGPIIAANHRINIIEAIAAAGDIPLTGRKDNVLITRMNNGKREYARINLNSRDLFNSPYYYLKQNDIVYVEPNKVRRQESNTFFKVYLPIFTTVLSTALAIYGIVVIADQQK